MSNLSLQECEELTAGSPALLRDESEKLLKELNANWSLSEDEKSISRSFQFKNFYQTMAFTNQVAMIAHEQDHHPEMSISYNRCRVEYSPHSVNGLSLNDFICAAKTDKALTL